MLQYIIDISGCTPTRLTYAGITSHTSTVFPITITATSTLPALLQYTKAYYENCVWTSGRTVNARACVRRDEENILCGVVHRHTKIACRGGRRHQAAGPSRHVTRRSHFLPACAKPPPLPVCQQQRSPWRRATLRGRRGPRSARARRGATLPRYSVPASRRRKRRRARLRC